ncbi:MAG: hypothetical protein ACJA1A_003713, partial [Saprospiraceae bacterium]
MIAFKINLQPHYKLIAMTRITNALFSAIILCISFSGYSQTVLLDNGSNWSYYDNQNEPSDQGGNDWTALAYDDTSWSTGDAQLGYGDSDESTVINDQTETAYFRHTFSVADPSIYDAIDLNLTYDDGAIVYLNGSEIWRVNMPTGSVNYNTTAAGSSNDNDNATATLSNTLLTGTNVLSVEVHQVSTGSSDISFDLKVSGSIPGSVNVNRGPYLQKASPTSITVRYRTDDLTETIIEYGTSLGNLNLTYSNTTPKTEHIAQLNGLSANTKYYYKIKNNAADLVPSSSDLYFQTHPTTGTVQPVRMWILGDPGTANNNQRAVRDAYYNYVGSGHTDGILFLGDNAYNDGTDLQYQNAMFSNMYEEKLKNSVAWSCLGNHDGYSADSDSQSGPYYDIFTFPTAAESGGLASGTEAYYSFDYGNIHFIALESYETDRSVGGAMYNWAQADIQATTQEWIVAYWHHPPYTKGSHDSDTETNLIQMRQNFLPMLEGNGVDLILSGHSHSYERSYLLNGHYGNANTFSSSNNTVGATGSGDGKSDGNGAYAKTITGPDAGDGTVYIATGSAGKITNAPLDHQAMFYSVAQLGSCVLEVNGNNLDVKFVRETGAIDDYFTITKEINNCTDGDPCDDGNACTNNDIYDANCNCSGTDLPDTDNDGICDAEDSCPNLDNSLIGTSCDDGNPNTINDTYKANCSCSGTIPGTDPVTICVSINSGADDVEENDTNGLMYDNSSDLELVFDSYQDQNNQTVGLRFNSVDVPQGASITEAYIQFTTDETSSGTTNLVIRGENVDNSASFSTSAYDISNRDETNNFVNWSPPAWNSVGETGAGQLTPNLSQVVQEIVDRSGYAQNNSMTFIITGSGSRTAESYNGSSASAPQLCITYDFCPGAGNSCDDLDPCTVNDVTDGSCGCAGTFADADNDGVCDADDICPGGDDNIDTDNDGTPDFCDNCDGTTIGNSCDDGDACTTNDVIDANCNCAGTFADTDNDGVCDADDICPGGDDNIDTDNDGTPDFCDNCDGTTIGNSCDDGDACTTDDVIDANCNCAGTFADADNDGVCDADDICPGGDDNIDTDNDGTPDFCDNCDGTTIGNSCDDGDACTTNDVIDANCNCAGTFADADNDGVCDADDICPGGDDNIDTDNDGTPDFCDNCDQSTIGNSCDDGDACTTNDIIDANCNCAGSF